MFNVGDRVFEYGKEYFCEITDISDGGKITYQPLIQFYADGTFRRTLKKAKPRTIAWKFAVEHGLYHAEASTAILERRIAAMEQSIQEIQAVMR